MQTINLNGISHEYGEHTRFTLQVGRYRNAYITRAVRTGEYKELLKDYQALQVSNGYKKRLIMYDNHAHKRITLLKQITERDQCE